MATVPRDSAFFSKSVEVAESFLQSAVIFDDSAGFSRDGAPVTLTAPDEAPIWPTSEAAQVTEVDASIVEPDENGAHYLYAKAVIDGFAKKRIICSVIMPEQDKLGESMEVVQDLAHSADIVVLDWSIFKDNGETALNILSRAIKGETDIDQGQLRLFVIYTGSPGLHEIFDKIHTRIASDLNAEIAASGKLSLSFRSAKVVVFAKPETSNLPDDLEDLVVPFDALADRLTEEFAEMTAGLVSNSVLNALATIRRNTHRILSRFQGKLDAPYLSHRFMLPDPSDAEALLIALIAGEFYGLLEDSESGGMADMSMIEAWLDAIKLDSLPLDNNISVDREDILNILRGGYQSWIENRPQNASPGKNKMDKIERGLHRRTITAYFSGITETTEEAGKLDEHFSHVTMMRARYDNPLPTLTLGTIIRCDADTEAKHFVCIQPRCDSVRVLEQRNFLFLPLDINPDNFDFVVGEGNDFHRLKCRRKPFDLVLIPFDGSGTDGKIIAEKNNDGHLEIVGSNGERHRWLGELRGDQGLRLANQFAETLSRIGLDEAEWLRRYATR